MRGEYDGLAVRLEDQEGDGLSGGSIDLLTILIEIAVPEADPETERHDFPGSSRVVVN